MTTPTDIAPTRQTEIIESAAAIFLRYGFKKTSMDDVAKAVGISRQALYLHFPNKEALFKAVVMHSVEAMRSAMITALTREDLHIENRLLNAFEAKSLKVIGSENLDELLATATKLLGPAVCEFEETLISEMARALRNTDVAARWKKAGMSARDLAEHLCAVSDGIKRKVKTPAEYRDRMRIAVRLVCKAPA
jgi:AcrR family transcriptional regulator